MRRQSARLLFFWALLICAWGGASGGASGDAWECASARAAQAQEDTNSLVAQIIEAYGGKERILEQAQVGYRADALLQHYYANHPVETIRGVYFAKGPRWRFDGSLGGDRFNVADNASCRWTQEWQKVVQTELPNNPRTVPELLLSLLGPDTSVTSVSPQTIERKLCPGLHVKPVGVAGVDVFVDPQTHLIAKMGSTEFLDYKNTMGFPLSCFRISYGQSGERSTDILLSDIKRDDQISDIYFEVPQLEPPDSHATFVIPFEMIDHRIMVKAKLNGKDDLSFIVDTGSATSCVDILTAEKIGPFEESVLNQLTAHGLTTAGATFVRTLELGDFALKNMELGVANLHTLRESPFQGIIGVDILGEFYTTIDYAKKQLILSKDAPVIPEGAIVLPAARVQSIFYLTGKLEGRKVAVFLVDTGAAFNVLSPSIVRELSLHVDDKQFLTGGLGLYTSPMFQVTAKSVQFGNLLLPNPIFLTPENNATSTPGLLQKTNIIGNPFWSQFRMTLDYTQNRLILEPQGPQTQSPTQSSASGAGR